MRYTFFIWLGLLASTAGAQSHGGAGISGGGGASSSYQYVRVDWGPPDSTQLVAAVLFRGSTNWGALRNDDLPWTQAAMDSASRAARARGNQAGGGITPRGAAWVEYDDRRRVVLVLDQEWSVPRRDSALVLLVDRIDGAGGPTTVDAVVIAVAPLAEAPDGATSRSPTPDFMRRLEAHWQRALRGNPKVRAFLESLR